MRQNIANQNFSMQTLATDPLGSTLQRNPNIIMKVTLISYVLEIKQVTFRQLSEASEHVTDNRKSEYRRPLVTSATGGLRLFRTVNNPRRHISHRHPLTLTMATLPFQKVRTTREKMERNTKAQVYGRKKNPQEKLEDVFASLHLNTPPSPRKGKEFQQWIRSAIVVDNYVRSRSLQATATSSVAKCIFNCYRGASNGVLYVWPQTVKDWKSQRPTGFRRKEQTKR